MPDCKRCGLCCHYSDGKKIYLKKPCKFLIDRVRKKGTVFKTLITSCRIYANRLKSKTVEGNVCFSREEFKFNIPNCPYNKEGLPMLEVVNE